MPPRITTPVIISSILLLCTPLATAQEQSPPPRSSGEVRVVAIESAPRRASASTPRAHLTQGVLSYAQVSMQFDDVPLREALRTFFGALKLDYAPYYHAAQRDSGMSPTVRINVFTKSMPAHQGLELILASAELGEKLAWQLRGPVVEVGTLERLARSGEHRSKHYEIKDLTIDIPYNVPPKPLQGLSADEGVQPEAWRRRPTELAAELMHHIMVALYPEAWLPPSVDSDEEVEPPVSLNGTREWANMSAYDEYDKPLQLFAIGRWAKMHYLQSGLIVTAPDFMHRAINGYPDAVAPDPKQWNVPLIRITSDS